MRKTEPKELLLWENQRNNNKRNNKLYAQKHFLIFFFFLIWLWLTRPKAMVLTLPFLKGRYLELAPLQGDSGYLWAARTAQLSSFLDRSAPLVYCKVLSQLDKGQKQSQRGTSLSLHVLILSLASQAALLTLPYKRFVYGEEDLSGTTPARYFHGGDPP